MKNLSLIFLLASFGMLSNLQCNAQGDWNTLGNNVASGHFLGSTNTQDIRFRVNNLQRMRLTTGTGFLGLGASNYTPDAQLHGDPSVTPSANGYRN